MTRESNSRYDMGWSICHGYVLQRTPVCVSNARTDVFVGTNLTLAKAGFSRVCLGGRSAIQFGYPPVTAQELQPDMSSFP